METKNINFSTKLHHVIIAGTVLIFCFVLFYMDKDVKKFRDLFNWGTLIVSSYYFIPTFAVCYFLFRKLIKEYDKSLSLFISLVIGIPLGLVLVITFFNMIK